MKIIIYSALIIAIALQLQKSDLQDTAIFLASKIANARNLQDTAISLQSPAISFADVEPSYFSPFSKSVNCSAIALADSMNSLANRLQVPAIWIYRTCIAESGMNPRAKNSQGAVGLIQFMPRTAKSLGTNTASLSKMSALEQLKYIELFYKPAMNQIYSYAEFRLFAFFPAALRWTNDRVLEAPGLSAKEVARRNPIHDTNGDMQITKLEYLKSVGYVLSGRN